MHIVNFGSLNLDHVYKVGHFVQAGETMSAGCYTVCLGGKGLNQSLAAARAGAEVLHAGMLGQGGAPLLEALRKAGVDTRYLSSSELPQGHAVIQVTDEGENSILLFPGSNHALTRERIDFVFSQLSAPGYLLVQNEVSNVPYIIRRANELGFQIILNASPFDRVMRELDYSRIQWLMINEVEGAQLSGAGQPEEILSALQKRYPRLGIVLTLGGAGCICVRGDERVEHGIFRVPVVDTTGAGDTFTGYFAAALAEGFSLREAVKRASAAAALSVTKAGAEPSIPTKAAVERFIMEYVEKL